MELVGIWILFRKPTLPKLNELSRSIVTSYSLKAYVELLTPQHRQGIANWLYTATAAAYAKLFK